jgi:hypothetical protein
MPIKDKKEEIKTTIKEFKTYKNGNAWYASVVVEEETPQYIQEYTFPAILLAHKNDKMAITKMSSLFTDDVYTRVQFGELGPLTCDGQYWVKVIKEKTQELTLEEIEKRLGYKVKIVSDKK